ncbi:hypothetical protein OTU49_004378 [Cherax quadricarinatus]|uniref:Uncharacterized protein n=1 Tax=Cherax quadricarinatus TaxID=27406 RepID=A0AAW0XBZ1_CHEQU
MSGLPLLPGYTVCNPTELQRPIRQSLGWKKGVPLVAPSPVPLLSEEDAQELARYCGSKLTSLSMWKVDPRCTVYDLSSYIIICLMMPWLLLNPRLRTPA